MRKEVTRIEFVCDSCGDQESMPDPGGAAGPCAPEGWAEIRIEERKVGGFTDVNRYHVCPRCLPGIHRGVGLC